MPELQKSGSGLLVHQFVDVIGLVLVDVIGLVLVDVIARRFADVTGLGLADVIARRFVDVTGFGTADVIEFGLVGVIARQFADGFVFVDAALVQNFYKCRLILLQHCLPMLPYGWQPQYSA